MPRPSGYARGREIEIGSAAEHLVCADLILAGYRAFLGAQGLPYDILLDVLGVLVRVGVKGTLQPSLRPAREANRFCYQFAATRSKRDSHGKSTARAYTKADLDLMAFVALDLRIVAYAPVNQTFVTSWHIDPPGVARNPLDRLGRRNSQNKKRFEDFTLGRALSEMGIGDA